MRRSSRARTTQPPAPPTQPTAPASLNALTRAERNTRSNNKVPSPQESTTQRSESLDDTEGPGRGDPPTTRRSKRSDTNEKDDSSKRPHDAEVDEGIESEEVTRCICGHAEYPGPPPSRDASRHHSTKSGIREENGDKNIVVSEVLSEDTGNFFIQCDRCQVWQHGGCVGLTDESMSPDEYFCENCKPEYHKRHRSSVGPQSSRYLPVLEASSPDSSVSSSNRERSGKKEGKSRQAAHLLSSRRRATMNSRDAAYDEDEMLRRAIEESRETGSLGKRPRDESEDVKTSLKRQRTSSHSQSPSKATPHSQAVSEDESSKPNSNGANASKKVRGAAAKNYRERETRDRQMELAIQRAEAASKRNARSERRRADDSSPPTPTLSPRKDSEQSSTASQKPSVSEAPAHRGNNLGSHRKTTGRPAARRGRLGRNQYTRDQPFNGGGGSGGGGGGAGAETPKRSNSRDPGGRSSPFPGMNAVSNGINGESGRSSRPKYHHPNRTSMNEMKRRVTAILEFINRMREDNNKANQNHSEGPSSGPSGSRTPNKGATVQNASGGTNGNVVQTTALVKGVEAGLSSASTTSSSLSAVTQVNGEEPTTTTTTTTATNNEEEFQKMASAEMRHVLTRELTSWQDLYGRYGEK